MKRLQLFLIVFFALTRSHAFPQPDVVVKAFGDALSSWCSTNDISYREKIDSLCLGLKKCRVEDKIHTEYQKKRGLVNYETFVLDMYLNMFQTEISTNIQYQMSNIKVGATDMMPDGQLSFVTADIKVSGPINHTVTDLFLVRDGKITGIYNYSSQLSFSHLNGSLIRALKVGRYIETFGFQNGYAVVTNEGKHAGLIDIKGDVIIPCMWDGLDYVGGVFAKGFKFSGEYCVYDLRYNAKPTPLFGVQNYLIGTKDEPVHFMNGMATVYSLGRESYGFLREDDISYSDIKYDYKFVNRFSDNRACVVTDEAVQVIDKDFNVIWKESDRYSSIGAYHEGLCPIQDNRNKLWGFMDIYGNLVIDCKFENVDRFSEGYACVEIAGDDGILKTGVINKKGKFVIPPEFDGKVKNYYFKDGYIPLFKDIYVSNSVDGKDCREKIRRASLIGLGGKPLKGFSWEYDNIGFFYFGLAQCEKNKKYGFLDRFGQVVVPLEYDEAYCFENGFAVVGKEIDGKIKYGYLNTDGILVVPCIYDDASDFNDGVALVKQNGNIGLIDVYGNSTFISKNNNSDL